MIKPKILFVKGNVLATSGRHYFLSVCCYVKEDFLEKFSSSYDIEISDGLIELMKDNYSEDNAYRSLVSAGGVTCY